MKISLCSIEDRQTSNDGDRHFLRDGKLPKPYVEGC